MQQQPALALAARACRAAAGRVLACGSVPSPCAAVAYASAAALGGGGEASGSGSQLCWVFLGPPGVGKGTYASRIAAALGVPHIAAGDLVRAEIKSGSALGQQMQQIVSQGQLLPDEVIIELLQHRLQQGQEVGEGGFILDGFPRTVPQAERLSRVTAVQLALNLSLRREVLVEKCCGRRLCRHCGKHYNVADIYLPASEGRPEIVMPPLPPPAECAPHLEVREDDTEEIVLRRLEVYAAAAAPVEDYYRRAGLLLDFEITGGIPQTQPRLMEALAPYIAAARRGQQGAAAGGAAAPRAAEVAAG